VIGKTRKKLQLEQWWHAGLRGAGAVNACFFDAERDKLT
jgi:hypothetical protein